MYMPDICMHAEITNTQLAQIMQLDTTWQ